MRPTNGIEAQSAPGERGRVDLAPRALERRLSARCVGAEHRDPKVAHRHVKGSQCIARRGDWLRPRVQLGWQRARPADMYHGAFGQGLLRPARRSKQGKALPHSNGRHRVSGRGVLGPPHQRGRAVIRIV